MGRLELPLPEIGIPLNDHARDMQAKIRANVPSALRESIVVKTFKKGDRAGIAIEYDDRAENFVYTAMEYPLGVRRKKSEARR